MRRTITRKRHEMWRKTWRPARERTSAPLLTGGRRAPVVEIALCAPFRGFSSFGQSIAVSRDIATRRARLAREEAGKRMGRCRRAKLFYSASRSRGFQVSFWHPPRVPFTPELGNVNLGRASFPPALLPRVLLVSRRRDARDFVRSLLKTVDG